MRTNPLLAVLMTGAVLASSSPCAETQQADAAQPAKKTSGVDSETGNTYVIFPVEGKLVTPTGITIAVPEDSEVTPPHLTGQCSRDPSGKYIFELLADFGGLKESPYYRPWRPSALERHPPHYPTIPVTMEFFGYTKAKPFKRQWQALPKPQGQFRYDPASGASTNMESVVFFMKYLLALPTLRLTAPGKAAQYDTAEWQKQIRADPLCQASGL